MFEVLVYSFKGLSTNYCVNDGGSILSMYVWWIRYQNKYLDVQEKEGLTTQEVITMAVLSGTIPRIIIFDCPWDSDKWVGEDQSGGTTSFPTSIITIQ